MDLPQSSSKSRFGKNCSAQARAADQTELLQNNVAVVKHLMDLLNSQQQNQRVEDDSKALPAQILSPW